MMIRPLACMLALAVCLSASTEDVSTMLNVIPKPSQVDIHEGAFELNSKTVLVADEACTAAAFWLSGQLAPASGLSLALRAGHDGGPNTILFSVDSTATLGPEAYALTVSSDRVVVRAGDAAGAYYACQTLRQLLPTQIEASSSVTNCAWVIPCLRIEDAPRFVWRGCLIDEARHFLGKEAIKRQIDLIAAYKFNRLHWHLTDDQGWRIEINKYPKLTDIGAWRGADHDGGFYTQDDIREIVAYAQSRHVLIVPEIEMPGHAQAALASYPQLGCRGEGYTVGTRWGIYNDVYCAGKAEVVTFLEGVLTEVLELFPSPFIHLGGDEVPKQRWMSCDECQARIKAEGLQDEHELQSAFLKHFVTFLQQRGRRMIGWDEIMDGGLAEGAIVQAWRGLDWAIKAANMGHDVIVSPTSDCYFDYGYDAISTMKVFFFEPIPEKVKPDKIHHIQGVEGNLWGERIPNAERLDYQGFPRLCALAEVAWSPKEIRDGDEFATRIRSQLERLEHLGVHYNREETFVSRGGVIGQWLPREIGTEFQTVDWDISSAVHKAGRYNATLVYSAGDYAIDIEWVALLENGAEVARDTHKGFSGYNKDNITYTLDLPTIKAEASYSLRASIKGNGGTDSAGDVFLLTP